MRLSFTLALVLIVFALPGQGQTDSKERVRAKQPSVVNVEGRADPVDVDRAAAAQDRSLAAKVGGGIRSGAAWTGRGVLRFTGWVMGTQEDIPSERQRKQEDTSPTRSR